MGPLAVTYGAKEVSVACGIAVIVVCLVPLLSREVREFGAPAA